VVSKSVLIVLAFAAASVPSVAAATSGVASTIRSHLGLDYSPSCTLCHSSSRGGGAATKRFAAALDVRGFTVGDTASLESALDSLVSDGVDSDGDGTKDVDELLAATDPNSADNASIVGDRSSAAAGCTIRALPSESPGWAAFVVTVSSVLLFGRSRGRGRGRRVPAVHGRSLLGDS
jgi:hypothetical protein